MQPVISTTVAIVVGLASLLPFVSGAWERAMTTPSIVAGAYIATSLLFDFMIAVAITRKELRRAAPPPPKPTPTPKRVPLEPYPYAPLPQAIARIRTR